MISSILRFTLLGTTSSSRGHGHFIPKPVLDYFRHVTVREYGRSHPFLGYIHNVAHGFIKESKDPRRKANQNGVILLVILISTKSGEHNLYLHYRRHTH